MIKLTRQENQTSGSIEDRLQFIERLIRESSEYRVSIVQASQYKRDDEWLQFNINIDICSIELKWDGKKTKIWYNNEMRWIRITVWNGGGL